MSTPRWVAWAMLRTEQVRRLLKANCGQYYHWPIMLKNYEHFLPIDNVYTVVADNDNEAKP